MFNTSPSICLQLCARVFTGELTSALYVGSVNSNHTIMRIVWGFTKDVCSSVRECVWVLLYLPFRRQK